MLLLEDNLVSTKLASWSPDQLKNVGRFRPPQEKLKFPKHEANCIQEIVKNVLHVTDTVPKTTDENPIGVDRQMKNMMSLNLGGHNVGIIGILGMRGSGKTTIAKAVYDTYEQEQFDGRIFVQDISDDSKIPGGLVYLQNKILSGVLGHKHIKVDDVHTGRQKIRQRLSRKKVLIVLDKVDSRKQLEALAGARNWFGDGSRIIITTTDERLLLAPTLVNDTHSVSLLDDEEAIQLFSKYAFDKGRPTEAYKECLERVIRYAAGHPGALKFLGCELMDKPINEWESLLDSLATCQTGINNMLESSLNGLTGWQKELFLDITCFFNGWVKDEVIDILDSCGLFATSGLKTLKEKSLITFSKEFVQVHNLIQEMGRNIVRRENPDEPSRQSRLWRLEEVKDVLMENKGTEDIKAIVISNLHKLDARGAFDAFTSMKKLRLLHANTQRMVFQGIGSTCDAVLWIVQGSGCLKYLPCDLRWLTWDYFNLESWPIDFHAKELVGLQMRHSRIVDLCTKRDMKFLQKLEYLDLSFSQDLIRTPDFGRLPHLKRLNLEFCSSLVEVHTSIGVHSKLVLLNLRSCEKLESFPSPIKMGSLEFLNLSGCSRLRKMPDFVNMDKLTELDLSHNSIEELPSSIGDLSSLVYLDVTNCRNLTSIPPSIWRLNIQPEILLHGCPVPQDFLVRQK
ncbi:TMV resistance protein N-like protein [Tanacetum coccineum]